MQSVVEKVKAFGRRAWWTSRRRVVGPIRRRKMSQLNGQATVIVMGALREMIKNRKYAYVSSSNFSFSHLEEPGKELVVSLVESVIPLLARAQAEETKEKAEQLMLDKLSK